MSDNTRPRKTGKAARRGKAGRERKCLVTGETYPVGKLIRFVLAPDGTVIPDVAGRLPGRGGWILADGKTLQTAMKKKTFVRFGHRVLAVAEDEGPRVRVGDDLPVLVERLLRQRCLNYLGLVNRAGLLVSGFEKVRMVLKAGKCRALITAQDAAAGGRSKICSGLGNVLEKLRVIDMFTREELGQTLGLSNGVHVALLSGEMTESFLNEFSRYENVVML